MHSVSTFTTPRTFECPSDAYGVEPDRKPSRLADFRQPFAKARSKAHKMLEAVTDAVRDAGNVWQECGQGVAKAAGAALEAGCSAAGKTADAAGSAVTKLRKIVSAGSSFAEASTAINAEAQRLDSTFELEAKGKVDGSRQARADSTPERPDDRAPSGLHRREGYQAPESYEPRYESLPEAFFVMLTCRQPQAYDLMCHEVDLHYHLECVKCEEQGRTMSPVWPLVSTHADLVWSHFFDPVASGRLQSEMAELKHSLYLLTQL